jgi:hypothetical protein
MDVLRMVTMLSLTVLLGCSQSPQKESSKESAPKPKAVTAVAQGEDEHEGEHQHEERDGSLTTQEAVSKKSDDGKVFLHGGMPLSAIPEVAIADLVANPQQFVGKQVKISGNIAAMCMHHRDWFALVDDKATDAFVRAMTGHSFLVPKDAVGRRGRAEGTIEIVEIDEKKARRIAKRHKLGNADKIDGPVKQVAMSVLGAEFY